jgi:hypothetical protein
MKCPLGERGMLSNLLRSPDVPAIIFLHFHPLLTRTRVRARWRAYTREGVVKERKKREGGNILIPARPGEEKKERNPLIFA